MKNLIQSISLYQNIYWGIILLTYFKTFKSLIICLASPAVKISQQVKSKKKIFFPDILFIFLHNRNSGWKGIYKQANIKNKLLVFVRKKTCGNILKALKHTQTRKKAKMPFHNSISMSIYDIFRIEGLFSMPCPSLRNFRAKKGFDEEWNLKKDENSL